MNAIDPDGRDTWFIPGTAGGMDDRSPETISASEGFGSRYWFRKWQYYLGDTGNPYDLEWTGANEDADRQAAASRLANSIMSAYRNNRKNASFVINIVAHSHGGNIAMLALNIIAGQVRTDKSLKDLKINSVVIAGTPQRPEYGLTRNAQRLIANKVSVYSDLDNVQPHGGRDGDTRSQAIGVFFGSPENAGRHHSNSGFTDREMTWALKKSHKIDQFWLDSTRGPAVHGYLIVSENIMHAVSKQVGLNKAWGGIKPKLPGEED